MVHPQENRQDFSLHNLEKLHRITYISWEGDYTIHKARSGPVKLFKDEQGLPYINLDGLGQEIAIMLLETEVEVQAGARMKQRMSSSMCKWCNAIMKAASSKRC
jgi:hypothetical protein